jgi:hypothetical protein
MVVEKVNIAGVAALETENHSPVPAFKEPLQSSMLEISDHAIVSIKYGDKRHLSSLLTLVCGAVAGETDGHTGPNLGSVSAVVRPSISDRGSTCR